MAQQIPQRRCATPSGPGAVRECREWEWSPRDAKRRVRFYMGPATWWKSTAGTGDTITVGLSSSGSVTATPPVPGFLRSGWSLVSMGHAVAATTALGPTGPSAYRTRHFYTNPTIRNYTSLRFHLPGLGHQFKFLSRV